MRATYSLKECSGPGYKHISRLKRVSAEDYLKGAHLQLQMSCVSPLLRGTLLGTPHCQGQSRSLSGACTCTQVPDLRCDGSKCLSLEVEGCRMLNLQAMIAWRYLATIKAIPTYSRPLNHQLQRLAQVQVLVTCKQCDSVSQQLAKPLMYCWC